ncbi:MAG: BatD family protein, partial [Myxococcota bacterium]|nr:BatD family protein [Myxococcota bacterium]
MSAARGRRLAVALSALALGGAAPEPPCRTSVSVEPSAVVVGQQAIYRLRILRREDVSVVHWEESLSFPSFRSEALPSRAPGPEVREVGDGYLVFEERRALFPARSGELSIPPARLRCTVGRGAQRRELIAAVPPARLRVEPLPGAGRPDGFTGLVGPVRANVSLSTERLRLGETVSLTVTLRGPGNVWSAEPPYDAARDFPGVDVFPRPATLHREAGDRLVVRRGFGFDLVPRQTGTLEIPATRIAYFDPEAGSYAAVELPAHRVQVAEAAATAPPAPREPRAAAPLPVALREPSWTPLVWV